MPEIITAEVVSSFLAANFDNIYDPLASLAKKGHQTVKLRLRSTYKSYLSRLLERYSKSKSFFVRSEPVPIYDFFVAPNLVAGRHRLDSPGILELTKISEASIITGSGGSGKTMFLRHLLVSGLRSGTKVPIMLELRQLNSSNVGLRSKLLDTAGRGGLVIDDEYFARALAAGHFLILLDGFDELEHDLREGVSEEIRELAETYPDNWYVLTSRPDSRLEGWLDFTTFRMAALTKRQAVQLVQLLPFDEVVKGNFIEALQANLFDRHESFLSNPLLLSIMLLTYRDRANIPDKLSLFYAQAYEALFQKHDALKNGFQRERQTELDIRDFGRAFSAFCLQSYDQRIFSFLRTEALDLFEKAKGISGLTYESAGMLDDSIQAVCLLLEDGLDITFAHRSFQEYFVARYIRSAPSDLKGELIARYATALEGDAVLQLTFELDQSAVEESYILPKLDDLKESIGFKRKVGVSHLMRYIRSAYSHFKLDSPAGEEVFAAIKDQDLFQLVRFVWKNYDSVRERVDLNRPIEQELVKYLIDEMRGADAIATKDLRTNMPFFQLIAESGGLWSMKNLEAVISVADEIRKRHHRERSSLNSLLGLD